MMVSTLFSFLFLVHQLPELQEIEVPAGETLNLNFQGEEFVELGEVELQNNSKLVIPPFKSLRIQKLVTAPGAKIELVGFHSGSDGGASVDGGHGSNGTFFIDRIEGNVLVESRGGDGGDGEDGRHGQQGVRGGKGQDAPRLFFFRIGNGRDGKPGGRGQDGEDGGAGGQGGNGGEVRVYYISKTAGSKIYVDVAAGDGGRGGRGGLGGLGGTGGPGGRGWRNGSQGAMGASGEPGRPGRPGSPGKPGTAATYQVSRSLYLCLVEYEYSEREFSDGEWLQCLDG